MQNPCQGQYYGPVGYIGKSVGRRSRLMCLCEREHPGRGSHLLGADFRDLNLRLARSLHEDLKGMASIQTDERW